MSNFSVGRVLAAFATAVAYGLGCYVADQSFPLSEMWTLFVGYIVGIYVFGKPLKDE